MRGNQREFPNEGENRLREGIRRCWGGILRGFGEVMGGNRLNPLKKTAENATIRIPTRFQSRGVPAVFPAEGRLTYLASESRVARKPAELPYKPLGVRSISASHYSSERFAFRTGRDVRNSRNRSFQEFVQHGNQPYRDRASIVRRP